MAFTRVTNTTEAELSAAGMVFPATRTVGIDAALWNANSRVPEVRSLLDIGALAVDEGGEPSAKTKPPKKAAPSDAGDAK